MAAVASPSEIEQAAAGEPSPTAYPRRRATLDPQLFMAARRGDSKLLKDLLQLKDDDDVGEQDTRSGIPKHTAAATSVAATAAQVSIDMEVDLRAVAPPAAAAAPEASSPSFAATVLDEDGVTMEGGSLLHVVAACGDTEKFLDCVDVIVRNKERKSGAAAKRRALEARNSKGDTPLHCAAGAGNAQMISLLVALITSTTDDVVAAAAANKAFLRMRNESGETALHQVVRAADNKVACIDQLMDVDPELACIPCHDEGGASPLYLAISLGEVEIARHLYVKSKGKLSYSGPDGRNVLHAAVYRGQALPMILEWLESIKSKAYGPVKHCAATVQEDHLHMSRKSRNSNVSLVSQLTSQRDRKHKGSTPLHLAASLNGWPHAWLLSKWYPEVWPSAKAIGTLLLDANESMAYQADDEGSYPIHVAAWSGSTIAMKVLLERCPDCATLRDGKGRTFLHVAAENEHLSVVRYVVSGEMPMLLNAQDSNGETALHCAVRAGSLSIFNCLLRDPRVRLDVANKEGMTPLDLSWTMVPAISFDYGFNPRSIVHISLFAAGTPYGGGRPELFTEKHLPKPDLDKESKRYTEATQVIGIVTALIATVTFASAFAFPGGYRSADGGGDAAAAGTPVLAGSYAFDAFILADTLAFICSISAACTLVYAGSPIIHIHIRSWYFNISAALLQSSARSLAAAFGLGLYLGVHNAASAIAACVIVSASSLYGHMELGRIIRMATTVRARIAVPRRAMLICLHAIFIQVLIHFWSYIIIFSLPAIRKRVH